MLRYGVGIAVLVVCLASDSRAPRTAGYTADIVEAYGSAEAVAHARQTHRLLVTRQYERAVAECDRGYEAAQRQGRPRAALFYLNALAGAHFHLGHYRKAQQSYMAARDLAMASTGQVKWAAFALANLSSLYMHAADTDSALAAAEEAHSLLNYMPRDERGRSGVLLQLGRVLLHRGDTARAHPLFEEAIRQASEMGDFRARAEAWEQLGLETLIGEDLDQAEPALNRALALRRLWRDPNVFATEQKLAQLSLRRGRIAQARKFIDAAFSRPNRDPVHAPAHWLYVTRAQILAAQGHWRAALDDFTKAIDAAEEWRGRNLFADAFRIAADAWLTPLIYDGGVEAAVRLYGQTRDPRYAEISWQFAERARSASLREGLAAGREWTRRMPPAYWSRLDRLRSLEAASFAGVRRATAAGDEATHLRMQLAEMEAAASPSRDLSASRSNLGENNPNIRSLTHFSQILGERRVFIGFLLGKRVSYRWVIHRGRIEVKALPGRNEIAGETESLRSAIQDSAADFPEIAQRVYTALFSGIPVRRETHWSIALDDRLFDLPVAALVVGRQATGPVYLVERQSFDLTPGAWAVGRREAQAPPQRFVGIGDGVYNIADPRYRAAGVRRPGSWFRMVPALFAGDEPPLQFPRLAGSNTEVEAAAKKSAAGAVILTGSRVSRASVLAALSEQPQYIHIAAHFLVEREGSGNAAVVLGVAPDVRGKPELELLTARDIGNLRVPGSVVVMSGCHSAGGRIVPVAGVLGLARSWLAAGAGTVVATQWPTPDDSGEIFSRFYAHMAEGQGSDWLTPAEALRRAQMEMLRSRSWRSEPKHWAAYQTIGRSN